MLKTHGFGKMAQDPKSVQIGSSVKAYFTVMCSEKRKGEEAIQINNHFIDCEVWDTAADYLLQNFKKGDRIYVEGIIRQERWEKDGVSKSKLIVRVTQFESIQERS